MLQFTTPPFCATCHHCHTQHNLQDLTDMKVELEPGTNQYEEDTVTFICPTCKKKVDNALVTR